jgi:hypothetical protein
MFDQMGMGGQKNPLMEMLMALMGQQQGPQAEPEITIVDEMQASPLVDLTGAEEEESQVGDDTMAQLMAAFQQ